MCSPCKILCCIGWGSVLEGFEQTGTYPDSYFKRIALVLREEQVLEASGRPTGRLLE